MCRIHSGGCLASRLPRSSADPLWLQAANGMGWHALSELKERVLLGCYGQVKLHRMSAEVVAGYRKDRVKHWMTASFG